MFGMNNTIVCFFKKYFFACNIFITFAGINKNK